MFTDQQRHWCLFTSAGDKNSIRLWLAGNAPRRWDLIVAYYGDNDQEFSKISQLSSYALRSKGSKFQNLKKLVTESARFFDRYSHVWVCDDDILMSSTQIEEAFELTETLGFWVAQPALHLKGKMFHWITCTAGSAWDYRLVNFVEVSMPIFRRDKLIEFLAAYDGGLTGWGIDFWFMNLFNANEFARFAIIDKVRVVNPRDEDKGRREIDRLQSEPLREADWRKVQEKYGFVEYPEKVFAYCKLAPKGDLINRFIRIRSLPTVVPALLETLRRSGLRNAIWLVRCGFIVRRQRRRVRITQLRTKIPAKMKELCALGAAKFWGMMARI